MATDRIVYTFVDGRKKSSKTAFNIVSTTAGNIAAAETARDALRNAMKSLIDGDIKGANIEMVHSYLYAIPSSPDITRGDKWAVTMQDDASMRLFTVQIPTAERNAVTPEDINTDGTAKLGSAHWTAFVDLVEAAPFKGPAGGGVTVISARKVTRRA